MKKWSSIQQYRRAGSYKAHASVDKGKRKHMERSIPPTLVQWQALAGQGEELDTAVRALVHSDEQNQRELGRCKG